MCFCDGRDAWRSRLEPGVPWRSSVASINVFIGPSEMNSAGTACAITFYSARQSFYSIVLLSPDVRTLQKASKV